MRWLGGPGVCGLEQVGVHGFAQVGEESVELLELVRGVLGHDGVHSGAERAEEFVGEVLDFGAAAEGDDAAVGVFAGADYVTGLLQAVQESGGRAVGQGDSLAEAGRGEGGAALFGGQDFNEGLGVGGVQAEPGGEAAAELAIVRTVGAEAVE